MRELRKDKVKQEEATKQLMKRHMGETEAVFKLLNQQVGLTSPNGVFIFGASLLGFYWKI